jgi:hypothetical protein
MTRKVKTAARKKEVAPSDDQPADDTPESSEAQLFDRPDGFYWLSPDGTQEFGPFETLELARADMESNDGPQDGSIETLQEAESEIGVADWIDPETGELSESQSAPRLAEE